MGNEDIGRRRSYNGFPFCLAFGFLGKINDRRYDFNPDDVSPYDASSDSGG